MRGQPHVLVVAGSDSLGGAGIARDVATISHFGVRTSLAITAVTAQTHRAVIAVETMSASLVAAQMRSALAADPIAAIKIGMLATTEVVEAVADVLAGYVDIPVVLDPVLASSSGAELLSDMGVECLRRKLLSISTLITPNLPELGILTGCGTARSDVDIAAQAARLLDRGSSKVLVKGGHAQGPQTIDTLYAEGAPPRNFVSPRHGIALRGTGCMLSSAIAAHLALGHAIDAAISHAKAFMDERFDAERLDRKVRSDIERGGTVGAPNSTSKPGEISSDASRRNSLPPVVAALE
jgi:hydroxymethylpyrimidine/phosphomethylpyrimidine kinase